MYKPKFAVCPKIRTKHTNAVCLQNLKFLIVQPGGTGSMIRFKRSKRHMADRKPTSFSGLCDICLSFLKLVRKIAKATTSYGMSVSLSLSLFPPSWKISAATGWIFMKYYI
jgi:hypothetical protein